MDLLSTGSRYYVQEGGVTQLPVLISNMSPPRRSGICVTLLLPATTPVLAKHSIRFSTTRYPSRHDCNRHDSLDCCHEHEGQLHLLVHMNRTRPTRCLAQMGWILVLVPGTGAHRPILYPTSLGGQWHVRFLQNL